MPVLYILGGPNGVGKTTFYASSVQSDFIAENLPFINVDIITKRLGGFTEANYVQATEIYRVQVKKYMDLEASFMIESNLADSRSYEWLSLMKRKGYRTVLLYLSTSNVRTNLLRIERRVVEGGHDIPESIVRSRYTQSHSYLKLNINLFNEVFLIDNSTDLPQVQLQMEESKIVYREPDLPDWVKEIISIYERLQGRQW
jgi:predicted ABC-type ATPase